MKHTKTVTYLLISLFFISQVIGLLVLQSYVDKDKSSEGNIVFENLPFQQERPPLNETTSFIWIFVMVIIGTIIALLLLRYKLYIVWKIWFFLAIWACIIFALGGFVNENIAALIGLIFAILKVFKPNAIVHNLVELLIYAGIATIGAVVLNYFIVMDSLLFAVSNSTLEIFSA